LEDGGVKPNYLVNIVREVNILVVYVLKNGSYEGVYVVDIFETKEAAVAYAEKEGLTPANSTGGYYVEEVEVKT
jgi:hypothetical protein